MFSQVLYIITLFWVAPCIFCNRHSRLNLFSDHIEDKDHLKQHVHNDTDVNNMSIKDVRFKYFISHDYNGDYRLDGQEILKGILHYQESVSEYVFSDKELAMFLDPILERDDRNDDGFLDYLEFMASRYVN